MKILLTTATVITLLTTSAMAQRYGRPYREDSYGSFGGVPTVASAGSYHQPQYNEPQINSYQRQYEEEQRVNRAARDQINNMHPYQFMGHEPVSLGGR